MSDYSSSNEKSKSEGNGISKRKRAELRLNRQAESQRKYRRKLIKEGLTQLNVMVPQPLYSLAKEFFQQDRETLETILKRA